MHVSVLDFFHRNADCSEFNNKRILEVGSKFVNGSVRPLIERFCHPKEYVGIDIFDVVISTEVLEHVFDWRLVINNMKTVLKRDSYIHNDPFTRLSIPCLSL